MPPSLFYGVLNIPLPSQVSRCVLAAADDGVVVVAVAAATTTGGFRSSSSIGSSSISIGSSSSTRIGSGGPHWRRQSDPFQGSLQGLTIERVMTPSRRRGGRGRCGTTGGHHHDGVVTIVVFEIQHRRTGSTHRRRHPVANHTTNTTIRVE